MPDPRDYAPTGETVGGNMVDASNTSNLYGLRSFVDPSVWPQQAYYRFPNGQTADHVSTSLLATPGLALHTTGNYLSPYGVMPRQSLLPVAGRLPQDWSNMVTQPASYTAGINGLPANAGWGAKAMAAGGDTLAAPFVAAYNGTRAVGQGLGSLAASADNLGNTFQGSTLQHVMNMIPRMRK